MLEVFLWPAHSTGRERPSSPAQHCAFKFIVSHSSACLSLLCAARRHLHLPMFEGCLTADNTEAVASHQCTMAINILIEGASSTVLQVFRDYSDYHAAQRGNHTACSIQDFQLL